MDVADQSAADGVVVGLVPDIGEKAVIALDDSLLGRQSVGVIAAIGIQEKHPVRLEAVPDPAEISQQGRPLRQQPIAEVQGTDDILGARFHGEHVVQTQGHPFGLGLVQPRQIMGAPPIQHLVVDIDTRGLIGLAPPHPFAAQGRGAAEILSQPPGGLAAQVAVGTVDEIHLRLGALDRLLIELVAVRLIGEGGGGG